MFVASAVAAQPLPTVDQNPFLAGFGLPQPPPAELRSSGRLDATLAFNWSSTAAFQRTTTETLTVDTESRETVLSVAYAISDSLTVRAHLPYRYYTGGVLDTVVEAWHTTFDFPKGDRVRQPRNRFLIDYERSGAPHVRLADPGHGIGDVAFDIGLRLHSDAVSSTALWGRLKAPTGRSADLLGSDSWGGSIDLAHQHRLSSRWSVYIDAGATYLPQGDVLPYLQEPWVVRGTLALNYRYSGRLTLTLQTDVRSAAFDHTTVELLGNAWLVALGGEYRGDKWTTSFGASEDAAVEASPDVTFFVGLGRRW